MPSDTYKFIGTLCSQSSGCHHTHTMSPSNFSQASRRKNSKKAVLPGQDAAAKQEVRKKLQFEFQEGHNISAGTQEASSKLRGPVGETNQPTLGPQLQLGAAQSSGVSKLAIKEI